MEQEETKAQAAPVVRAKFTIQAVTLYSPTTGSVKLSAVTDNGIPENQRFHKYTPCGTIDMSIDNPSAFEAFKSRLGQQVYVDFTPAT